MVNSIQKRKKTDTPWALLGDIEIEITTAPNSFSYTEGSKFVEIEKITEKPGLQFTGQELNSISLGFRFHCGWCDPEVQLKELQDAHLKHEPMQLTLGNGQIAGRYVIEEISSTLSWTDVKGRLISIEVTCNLKETAGKKSKKKKLKSPFKKRI